jgi:hypothetical protein
MVICKKVKGEIDYNDGEFAEVQTCGIEGIEKDLLLGTIQIHRENTSDTSEEFEHRFPVGIWLDIVTTTEITPESNTDEFAETGAPMDHPQSRLM